VDGARLHDVHQLDGAARAAGEIHGNLSGSLTPICEIDGAYDLHGCLLELQPTFQPEGRALWERYAQTLRPSSGQRRSCATATIWRAAAGWRAAPGSTRPFQPLYRPLRLGVDDEHGPRGPPGHLLGDGADQEAPEPGAPVRGERDRVHVQALRGLQDLAGDGVPFQDQEMGRDPVLRRLGRYQ